jgi:hypothetical protein
VINQPPAMCRSPASRWARAWAWRCGLLAMSDSASTESLLPPNATPLEAGLARLGQRLSAVDLPIADCGTRRPARCPRCPGWPGRSRSTPGTPTGPRSASARSPPGPSPPSAARAAWPWCARPCAPSTNASNWSRPIRRSPPCLHRAPAGAGP